MAPEGELCPVTPAEAEPWPKAPVAAACPDPGGLASPAPGEPPLPCAVVDAHLVWERQLAKLGSIDLRLVDEPMLGAVCDQIDQLEDLILSTPARTLEGAGGADPPRGGEPGAQRWRPTRAARAAPRPGHLDAAAQRLSRPLSPV